MRQLTTSRSPALARLCQFEVLGADEERRLFRNLKQAREQSARSPGARANPAPTRKDDASAAWATEIRNQIAICNLRLVVSVAKHFASPQQSLEDLVSEASLLLLRCVERFDADRGTRFSTYATRALAHHFVRLRRRQSRRFAQPMSGLQLNRQQSGPNRSEGIERLIHFEEITRLDEHLALLPRREQALLAGRFGLGDSEPRTFRELGVSYGLSKEWARVTTVGALERLRDSLAEENRP
jgi:RNA polymerase primary sigma factor